jgi:hypothetical protein
MNETLKKQYEYLAFWDSILNYDDKIKFNWNDNFITIIFNDNSKIELNFDSWTYINKDWFAKTFSFLNINFDLDDFKWLTKIIIPEFLKEKYNNSYDLASSRKVAESRENFNSSYDTILNTHK